jgi:hypothetical protein
LQTNVLIEATLPGSVRQTALLLSVASEISKRTQQFEQRGELGLLRMLLEDPPPVRVSSKPGSSPIHRMSVGPKLETSYALGLPNTPELPPKVTIDEPPPFLGTWPRVYIFILCYLAVVIAGFYVFSLAYAP